MASAQMLQLAVQSFRWTYSVFWQLCPQQGILVWGDGYYNGSIKTRKTVQPTEFRTEEASLQRSQQLRELYESLSAGETNQAPTRRPCAALSPEDLTESEWFYLMCISFSFPLGIGLPGKAFETQQPLWLTHANVAESQVFSRAILAKTVVCIPFVHGVLELGTTDNVDEDMELIQHAKSFFIDHHEPPPKPALSEHSTSDSVARTDQQLLHSQPLSKTTQPTNLDPNEFNQENEDDDSGGENDDNDDDDEIDVEIDTDAEIEAYNARISTQHITSPTSELSELMQIEMSEGIRIGSPDDCSNNLDTKRQAFMTGQTTSGQSYHLHGQHNLHEDLCGEFPESSGATQIQELSIEDAHYSETVSVLLHRASSRCSEASNLMNFLHFRQSAFSIWSHLDRIRPLSFERGSQRLLKCILFSVPNLHFKDKNGNSLNSKDGEGGSRFRKGTPQEELSANHVLAERRRREKLNVRFIILRSLVPFVTKMDKTSILGDTIEYVKQLRRRIQELESQNKTTASNHRLKKTELHNPPSNSLIDRITTTKTRKDRAVEYGRATQSTATTETVKALRTNVQVSIIEADALLELQGPYRDGILVDIMQRLHELRLEITSVQSSSTNAIFTAELRAKVKTIDRKKASIVEVKKAIYKVLSQ